MVLCSHHDGALVLLGVECSTFVLVNRGTSKRSELLPMGFRLHPSVEGANKFAARR